MAADIMHVYLTPPCNEKIGNTFGYKFGKDKGKKVIIGRLLYCPKSIDRAFQEQLARPILQSLVKVMYKTFCIQINSVCGW